MSELAPGGGAWAGAGGKNRQPDSLRTAGLRRVGARFQIFKR